jgi:hypothetical protein
VQPMVLLASHRISPESLIPVASVIVKPELEGISVLSKRSDSSNCSRSGRLSSSTD